MRESKQKGGGKPTQGVQANTIYRHRNEQVVVPDGYIAVGRITAAHSLRGELRVEPHTDFPERFAPGVVLFVGTSLHEATIEQARPHKQMMLLKLAGVDNRNDAESLRGEWLFVAEEDAILLDEDTYWVHDIIGMTVQTEEGQLLGTITDVLYTGANDVYVLQREDSSDGTDELLLPAIADVVQRVEPDEQRMTVRLLPGLLS
ncbi:MAG TPA: ribosome maturation factor RimM [Caldilineaceae bacterium]|nr:ribosome maturation factor RimM [Caldilineaceae bacterium]